MPFDGQEKQRRYEEFRDQHGRIYSANVDIKSGMPCEVLRPLGWKAPMAPDWYAGKLIPPTDDYEIVRMVPVRERARRGYQIEIDYRRWLQKWDDAHSALQRKIHDFAQGMTKSSGIMLELIANPPAELLRLVGRGPLNIPRLFIEAAAAGNPWALGESEKIPAKAEALLAELKPVVSGQRKGLIVGFDPLAEEGEDEGPSEALQDALIDPFGDVEEQADPGATGGKIEPVRASKKKTPKREPAPA